MNLSAMFSNVENTLKSVSTIVSSLVGLVSVFYLPGFIIVNLYLSSYGVRDFTLARVTYLAVGSTFVVFHVALWVLMVSLKPAVVSLHAGGLSKDQGRSPAQRLTHWLLFALKIMFIALVSCTPFWLLNILRTEYALDPIDLGSPQFGYVVLIGAMTLFLMWVYTRPTKHLLPSSVIFSVIVALVLWSRLIYPEINPAFSGGQLIKIRLVIADTDNAPLLTETGLSLDQHISLPLGLIDDTGEALIVLLNNGNVASIDKSLISNIVYVRSDPSDQDFSPALVTSLDDLTAP